MIRMITALYFLIAGSAWAETYQCKSEPLVMNGELELQVILGNNQAPIAEVSAGNANGAEGIQCQVQRHISRLAVLNCAEFPTGGGNWSSPSQVQRHPFQIEVYKRERYLILKNLSAEQNAIRMQCR